MNLNVVYQFIRSNRPFALSCGVGVNLRSADGAETSFEPEVLVAKAVGKAQIHASLIPEVGEDGKGLAYNLAALPPVPKHWIPTFEFNGRRSDGVNTFYATPGIYKHLPHRMEAGVGVPLGISRLSSRIGVMFKMTFEFWDKDDRHGCTSIVAGCGRWAFVRAGRCGWVAGWLRSHGRNRSLRPRLR